MPRIENGIHSETLLPALATAKALKLGEINVKCEAVLQGLTSTYPDSERLTFDQQKQEAEAYLDNDKGSAACPLLAPLAAARGISLEDLVNRVLIKARVFSAVSGAIIGQRQRMEDDLDACTSVSEVQGLEVSYRLPV